MAPGDGKTEMMLGNLVLTSEVFFKFYFLN